MDFVYTQESFLVVYVFVYVSAISVYVSAISGHLEIYLVSNGIQGIVRTRVRRFIDGIDSMLTSSLVNRQLVFVSFGLQSSELRDPLASNW